ncbi:MAG: HAD-IIB family hydrolase [Candidatus Bathyarchaeia archaeon]|jgi:mannosyl-3-phosphoglycerate phosphatase
MKTVVFTDLDGTVLDEKYSFSEVKPVIDQLTSQNVAVVICSSKTRKEIEFYRQVLNLSDPFISENGGAVFVPKGYFKGADVFNKKTEEYDIIEFGVPYVELRRKLRNISSRTGCRIIGFGDMSLEEVSRDSGLRVELAALAKQREYDEPFRVAGGDEKKLLKAAEAEDLEVTRGDRYYHLKGKHDKGTAVERLKELYVGRFSQIRTIGVGNSANDLSMLKVVDLPFFREKNELLWELWKKVLKEAADQNIKT